MKPRWKAEHIAAQRFVFLCNMRNVRIWISPFSCVLSASKWTGELGITKKSKSVTVIKSIAAVATLNVGKTGPNFKGMRQIARARTHELILPAYKSGNLIQTEAISQAEAGPKPCLRYFHVCSGTAPASLCPVGQILIRRKQAAHAPLCR